MPQKVVMLIAHDQFRDEEYQKPREILEQQGVEITVASSSLEIAHGMLGLDVQPDVLLQDVDPAAFDGVVFVGGYGASEFFDDPVAHALATKALDTQKLVGAICIAPSTLARAGVLKGRRVTSFESQEDDLKRHGANFTGADVEEDGQIVTGRGPEAAEQFGLRLAERLAAAEASDLRKG